MAAITKSALKAIKFYKHVVQSVEKFIQKVGFGIGDENLEYLREMVPFSRKQFLTMQLISSIYFYIFSLPWVCNLNFFS